jgi:hypothetical protein
MSGPPHLEGLKKQMVVRGLGSAGAMSRPPHLESLKK